MYPTFGIHVGNSTASIAIWKEDGKVSVLANDAGDRVTPAVMTFYDSEKVVGAAAKAAAFPKWNCTVKCNKRLMYKNLSENEILELNKDHRVALESHKGTMCYKIPKEDKSLYITPADVATGIYGYLYGIAKNAIHAEDDDIISCVMLVPTYFDNSSREDLKNAAEEAGWDVLQMVNEPTAAIVAYSLFDSPQPSQFILVYRVGGVSCEATVFHFSYDMVKMKGTVFRGDVGGDQLLDSVTNYLAEDFTRKYKLDPKESPRSMGKLKNAAETCMHVLSTMGSANCFVESLYEGIDFNVTISRARFESLISPLLSSFVQPVHEVLKNTEHKASDIQKVILCGGAMKIPKLQATVKDIFSDGNTEVSCDISPDEVLALGAAKQAGYIVQNCDDLTETLPASVVINHVLKPVTVEVTGAECEKCVLEDGLPLPCAKLLKLKNVKSSVIFHASQMGNDGESYRSKLELNDLTECDELDVEIGITSDYILELGILDRTTNEVNHIEFGPIENPEQ